MESEGSSKDYFRKSMAELIAILPQEAGNTKNWEKLLEPLANATDFNVVDIRHNDIIDCPTLYIEYKKEVYPIDVDWYEYHFVEDTRAIIVEGKYDKIKLSSDRKSTRLNSSHSV